MRRLSWIPFGLWLAAAGCKPNLGYPASLVTGPRILAVRAMPPDATPGSTW
jgi:hypothetical protein